MGRKSKYNCKVGDQVEYNKKNYVVAQVMTPGSTYRQEKAYITASPIMGDQILTRTRICVGVDWQHAKIKIKTYIPPKPPKRNPACVIINKIVTYKGETKPLIDFVKELGLNRNTVVKRVSTLKTIEQILTPGHLPGARGRGKKSELPADLSRVNDYLRFGKGLMP